MKFTIAIVLIVTGAMVALGQTESKVKNSQDDRQASLEGLTEALLIDGQPVLRILSRGNVYTEVKRQKRDGEDTFVFEVKKLKILTFPISRGALYVTKDRVFFDPYEHKSSYFAFSKKDLKEVKVYTKGYKIGFVDIKGKNGGESLAPFFNDEQGLGYMISASYFMVKTIENFDSASAEFNQLTASVRQNGDTEEVGEEETEANVNDKYDRFKDITIVSTSKMLVRSNKRSIRTYAHYSFKGKAQKKPEKVSLYFYASSALPLFREDNLELNFLVDNKRVSLGEMKLADEEKTKTTTKQTVVVILPYETFEQIANGKKVEFQIGTLEYKLIDVHLDAFKKLLIYKIEE